jgi:predicted component of type VI protein secretion system
MGCGYSNGEWAKGLVIAVAQMSVVVTACASSQPVRQKRPMRVTVVKTK